MANRINRQRVIPPAAGSAWESVKLGNFLLTVGLFFFALAGGASAQSTAFTFQGRLNDSGTPANGNYDLELKLFDTATPGTGTQIGATLSRPGVKVTSGVFTVQLDFTVAAFPGGDRFLEVGVTPSGSGNPLTILDPRQPITPAPYALYSVNATNATFATNAAGNFNIAGNSTVGGTLSGSVVNATTQYDIGSNRVLSISGATGTSLGTNVFAGIKAGSSNTPGPGIQGIENSFFGESAGFSNTSGGLNSFFGNEAGLSNLTGTFNSFFGAGAGLSNQSGNENSFFGVGTGSGNSSGSLNSFFGRGAGFGNLTGTENTIIGERASLGSSDLTYATALGAHALVSQNNSLVLGSINGVNGATGSTRVGIGTTTPTNQLDVDLGSSSDSDPGIIIQGKTSAFGDIGLRIKNTGTSGVEWYVDSTSIASNYGGGKLAFAIRGSASPVMTLISGRVGIGTTAPDETLTVNGNADKSGGGSWDTFSDERLKNIKGPFTPGLEAVMKLEPIRYEYKRDNALGLKADGEHIGFTAQTVQRVIPEAVTENGQGYLLINNDPILWTMLNAIKEQEMKIELQQGEIESLRKLACLDHPEAEVCRK